MYCSTNSFRGYFVFTNNSNPATLESGGPFNTDGLSCTQDSDVNNKIFFKKKFQVLNFFLTKCQKNVISSTISTTNKSSSTSISTRDTDSNTETVTNTPVQIF